MEGKVSKKFVKKLNRWKEEIICSDRLEKVVRTIAPLMGHYHHVHFSRRGEEGREFAPVSFSVNLDPDYPGQELQVCNENCKPGEEVWGLGKWLRQGEVEVRPLARPFAEESATAGIVEV